MSFRYPKPRREKLPRPDVIELDAPKEELIGIVHGRQASDIEERMYHGFLNNNVDDNDIEFQPTFYRFFNVPGEIRPDFAIHGRGLLQIFFADGDFWHKTPQATLRDKANDAILFHRLQGEAEYPIRIPGEDLETQELADHNVGNALRGGYEPAR